MVRHSYECQFLRTLGGAAFSGLSRAGPRQLADGRGTPQFLASAFPVEDIRLQSAVPVVPDEQHHRTFPNRAIIDAASPRGFYPTNRRCTPAAISDNLSFAQIAFDDRVLVAKTFPDPLNRRPRPIRIDLIGV